MTLPKVAIHWRLFLIVITPIVLLPLPLAIGTDEANCAYVVLMMAVFWMFELLPLAVTSFLPIFLFPLLGVLDVSRTCANYLKDTNFLFVGGLVVALAVELCNLHERIALRVLLFMGTKPRWLMLGFMLVTCFLSMWISNTATTAMMVPIAMSIIENSMQYANESSHNGDLPQDEQLKEETAIDEVIEKQEHLEDVVGISNVAFSLDELKPTSSGSSLSRHPSTKSRSSTIQNPKRPQPVDHVIPRLDFSSMSKTQVSLCKGMLLCICYSANIGGTGTLTGTGPNLVLKGQLDTLFKGKDTGITFASWMPFAIPPLIILLVLAWVLLQLAFLGVRAFFCMDTDRTDYSAAKELLKQKYLSLGSMSFDEWSVLFWFCVLVILWIFREPGFMPGWADGFRSGYMSDAVAAMFVAVIMFAWPNVAPWRSEVRTNGLVTWHAMQNKFPWSVIMLLGGGFALADGVKASNLSEWLGCELESSLKSLPSWAILTIFTIIITFMTEISSNTATASIFVPIMISVAETLKLNPLYFALPATIAPSFAFMLPVATPPNAICYEVGALRIVDMMWVGFIMNWLCIAVTIVNINTYAYAYFSLGDYPTWADTLNSTKSC